MDEVVLDKCSEVGRGIWSRNGNYFLMQVLRPYVVNISAFFCLIAFEGILGGLSYVNTFHRGNPNTREYSMSIAAFADSFGITCAAFAAIPLHNYLLTEKAPRSKQLISH
ncbi:unnamed protein product [Rodentolepis nana]|uniref:Battenin n=1 Tax=Rodentolepis nana TaxID=102285 RepID=A0A3P7RW73_RODNA|nr:unnamed protein product [Rodentolepis nana]